MKSTSGTSNILQYMIADKSPITGQQKWNRILGISKECLLKSFRILKTTTTDTKLQWFQVRVLHSILTTNRSVSKFITTQNDMCEFCGSHSETIQHLMWQCTKDQIFWKELTKILQQRCSHLTNYN